MLLLFIWHIFNNIFNTAVQYAAQRVQNDRFDNHVLSQPLKLCLIYAVIFNQLILADIFLFQRFPQRVISYHPLHPACILSPENV